MTVNFKELGADWEADHCLKNAQSPIDINTAEIKKENIKSAGDFKYQTHHYGIETNWRSKSNGHTLVYEPICEESECPYVILNI